MNKSNPLLSVIVPVYNTEKYLERCLESILYCSYKNIEIIIVDDNSPGNVKELVSKYKEFYSNIEIISNKENRGLYNSRIIGVEHSSGEYIAFLDSDDYVSIDFYRRLIRKAIESDSDMVMGEVYLQEGGKYKYYNLSHTRVMDLDLYKNDISDLLFRQEGKDWSLHVVWNKIYRKDLWDKCYEYLKLQQKHLIMCEDVLFSSILFYFAKHLTNIHGDFVYYVQRNDSSISSKNISYEKILKNIQDINLAFDLIIEFFNVVVNDNKYVDNINNWRNRLYTIWNNIINNCNILSVDKKKVRNEIRYLNKDSEDSNYFYSIYSDNICGLRGEEIKRKILDDNIKIISFDVFDTLIVRPFLEPIDLFDFLDIYVNKLFKFVDRINFKEIRIYAEKLARDRQFKNFPDLEDITLDDIYSEISSLLSFIDDCELEKIKKYEISLEEKYCYQRKYAKELFDLAIEVGKTVIITSDMYLPINVIDNILKKNGYSDYNFLYVSSDIRKTKASGNLFKYISDALGISGENILHIGDNMHSDILKAKDMGWDSYYLPKASDLLKNQVDQYYGGNIFHDVYHQPFLFRNREQYKSYSGLSALLGVVANKIFDNPYREFRSDTDFNGEPNIFGYFCVGMHLFSLTHWLNQKVFENNYQTVVFMARDGYLPMKAFELFNSSTYKCNVNINYLSLTRSVIFPLQIKNEKDLYSLLVNMNIFSKCPRDILDMFKDFIPQEKFSKRDIILKKYKIELNKYFCSIDDFFKFINVYSKEFFIKESFEIYKDKMSIVLNKIFLGKTATFDIGYSVRIESILCKLFNLNVTPHYVHINNDIPMKRCLNADLKIETFYNYSPGVTGVLRELLISELGPSCKSWNINNDKIEYIYKDYDCDYVRDFVIKNIQKNAIQFVSDVLSLFGEDVKYLFYQKQDASLPLEKFFSEAKYVDQLMFNTLTFEDDLGLEQKNVKVLDFWNGQMNNSRMPGTSMGIESSIYSIYPLWKRAIILYFLDRNLLKYKINQRWMYQKPIQLKVLKYSYRFLRRVYRFFKSL